MLRDWFGALVLALSVTSSVHAEELESRWHAPHGCPSAQEADRRLRERTQGWSALDAGKADVWIDHAPSGELRARVTFVHDDAREQRVLYARDCESLAEAVLLVVGMAFDSEEQEEREAPPQPEEIQAPYAEPQAPLQPLPPAPEKPVRVLPEATVETPRASRPMRATSLRVGVSLGIDRGALPVTSYAGNGSVAVGFQRWQFGVGISYFSRARVRLGEDGDAHVDFRLITSELRTCFFPWGDGFVGSRVEERKGFGLGPCASLELGGLRGEGRELSGAQTETGLWAAGMLGLGFSLGPYGRIVPTGSLALGFALTRPSFDVDAVGTLYQPKAVFMRATLGVAIELDP